MDIFVGVVVTEQPKRDEIDVVADFPQGLASFQFTNHYLLHLIITEKVFLNGLVVFLPLLLKLFGGWFFGREP